MALPILDLKLSDVAAALSMPTTNISMSSVFTNLAVNGNGLNPSYCPGADATARLLNLRTTPYSLNKFRGYDHNAGGALNTIMCSFSLAQDPCAGFSTQVTVYSTQATIALSFSNDQEIYSDSGGNTYASSGWYTEDTTNWYFWDASLVRWTNNVVCTSFLLVWAIGPEPTQLGACISAARESDYYFVPTFANTVPVTGEIVYSDSNGTTYALTGYYKLSGGIAWWQVGNNGLVVNHGKC